MDQACRVDRECELGPDVALGRGCVVESDVRITRSVIMDNTYIGGGLTIEDALVRKNLLIKCATGTVLHISDAFLLGGTEPARNTGFANALLQRLRSCCSPCPCSSCCTPAS